MYFENEKQIFKTEKKSKAKFKLFREYTNEKTVPDLYKNINGVRDIQLVSKPLSNNDTKRTNKSTSRSHMKKIVSNKEISFNDLKIHNHNDKIFKTENDSNSRLESSRKLLEAKYDLKSRSKSQDNLRSYENIYSNEVSKSKNNSSLNSSYFKDEINNLKGGNVGKKTANDILFKALKVLINAEKKKRNRFKSYKKYTKSKKKDKMRS